MQDILLRSLRGQLPLIRQRWEALLHVKPVNTPLACPDAVIHLLDWTLQEIFNGLTSLASRRKATRKIVLVPDRPPCPCGRNPLLAYFAAGQQAMREALILAHAAAPFLDPLERDASLQELDLVFQQIARREIDSFCGICQYRFADTELPCPGKSALAGSASAIS